MLMQFLKNLIPSSWGRGILINWKLNAGDFSTHWNSLLVLVYVSVLLFLHLSALYLYPRPTLASGIFVEVGLS